MSPLRYELAVCFLHLDDYVALGSANGAPTPSALRLMPRPDYPQQALCVVDFVLLGPGQFDDRDAVDGAALAPPGAKGVHSVFSHASYSYSS
jgi:hypothetical protein